MIFVESALNVVTTPVGSTVATPGAVDDQSTPAVTTLPSESYSVAVYGTVAPNATVSTLGVIATRFTAPEPAIARKLTGDPVIGPLMALAVACTLTERSAVGVTRTTAYPVSSVTPATADNVALPALTDQRTESPLNPPPSASSTRTTSGAPSTPPIPPVWLSPATLISWAGWGIRCTRVESLRCVGVSATTHTLSRSERAAVRDALYGVGYVTVTRVASLSRYPIGTPVIESPTASKARARSGTTVPPTAVVSAGRMTTRVAFAPVPTYWPVMDGRAMVPAVTSTEPVK